MVDKNIFIQKKQLSDEYLNHLFFKEIDDFINFYNSLSFNIFGTISTGISSPILNIDEHIFSSISGTIESIKDILIKGKINDSYALLRKYFDSVMINIYIDLFLENNVSLENLTVQEIDNWVKGKESIPEYRIISKYVKDSHDLKEITNIFKKDDRYKNIRNRCNDNTHYNYFYNFISNNNNIFNKKRVDLLNVFKNDFEDIFILHFAYLFTLKYNYMMSSDYIDSLELGIQPVTDSQYWVAPFIQEIFNKLIKVRRIDIADEMKKSSVMNLE